MEVIRPATPADIEFLARMLFEAFFWNPSTPRPHFDAFRTQPQFAHLLAGWGRRGDRALIAEDGTTRIGAAWFRLWTDDDHSYGYAGPDVPEAGIAVEPLYRSRGTGRLLLDRLIAVARDEGFSALSLSVDPANRARSLYESAGFRKVGESGSSWTLVLPLRE